jgi:hypothetical protein
VLLDEQRGARVWSVGLEGEARLGHEIAPPHFKHSLSYPNPPAISCWLSP